jgi:hypothetical protein
VNPNAYGVEPGYPLTAFHIFVDPEVVMFMIVKFFDSCKNCRTSGNIVEMGDGGVVMVFVGINR